MSAVSFETSNAPLLGEGLVTLPRVNLLPPEIGERRNFRRIQYGLGAGVLSAVAVVAGAFLLASGGVASAQSELDVASAETARLQAETAKYADVTQVYAQAAAAQAMLTEAMGEEVRYSQLMSDLSLSVPENVWLTNLTFAQAEVPAAVGGTEPGIGSLTVSGVGFSHDDVALWLESLAGRYGNPYFSSSTESLIGPRTVVNFESTAALTPAAYSGNYTSPAGG